MSSGKADSYSSMGGKKIVPDSLNTELIAKWLNKCSQLHASDCKPQYTDQSREVGLIDVMERTVVKHPD
jgi:hypothetical protein